MRINEENLEKAKELLKENIKIPKYLDKVVNSGEDVEGKALISCPLHDETSASFKYFHETESFYCFGCERGGTVVELHYYLMRREIPKYSRLKAILDLSNMFNVKIPDIFIRNTYNENIRMKKYIKPKIPEKMDYTDRWLLNQIELRLNHLKRIDKEKYIELCNQVDLICLIGTDKNIKLKRILECLKGGVIRED